LRRKSLELLISQSYELGDKKPLLDP
jgi:hypothetical protein